MNEPQSKSTHGTYVVWVSGSDETSRIIRDLDKEMEHKTEEQKGRDIQLKMITNNSLKKEGTSKRTWTMTSTNVEEPPDKLMRDVAEVRQEDSKEDNDESSDEDSDESSEESSDESSEEGSAENSKEGNQNESQVNSQKESKKESQKNSKENSQKHSQKESQDKQKNSKERDQERKNTPEYNRMLKDLFDFIKELRDKKKLKRILDVMSETGHLIESAEEYEFDLQHLSHSEAHRLVEIAFVDLE